MLFQIEDDAAVLRRKILCLSGKGLWRTPPELEQKASEAAFISEFMNYREFMTNVEGYLKTLNGTCATVTNSGLCHRFWERFSNFELPYMLAKEYDARHQQAAQSMPQSPLCPRHLSLTPPPPPLPLPPLDQPEPPTDQESNEMEVRH